MNVTSPVRKPLLSTQIEKAQALMRANDFPGAIDYLTPIVKSMDLQSPKPEEIFVLLMMADAQRFNGQPGDAYRNYVIASELDPKRKTMLERHILHCISEMREPLVSNTFEQHIVQYFHHTGLENTSIDRICIELLKQKFKLDDEEATIDFSEILADTFLTEAMSNLVLADHKVELFLLQLRNQVFTLAIETDLASELQPLVIALADHAERVEYAFSVNEAERIILLGIKTLLETEVLNEESLKQHLGSLMLYAMYEPIVNLTCCQNMAISNLSEWPSALQPLIKKIFLDRSLEHSLKGSIDKLGAVTHDVSRAVMEQYEQNPYPRWEHIFMTDKKVRYLDLYPNLKGLVHNRKKLDKHLTCLVAGAGTGKQPLWLAANCQDIHITALDLSLPSLCYAKRQSTELNINNVEFLQGDILELGLLEQKFDIIECSGVLHHMQDPEAGLKVLIKRLRNNGLLRIGLYSRIARAKTGITGAQVENVEVTLEDIRQTRSDLIQNATELLNLSRDFYTASECRDLLFHVQEHQYEIPEIKALLDRNNLDFLGFSPLAREIHSAFSSRFGPDANHLNLDQWHLFEQENPLIFKGMYQFHCQKRS